MIGTRIMPHDFSAVTRRLDRSFSSVCDVLAEVPCAAGQLRIDLPFDAALGTPPAVRTSGRLYGEGVRLARYTRVTVELTAWSRDAIEARLLPVTGRVPAWSRHRQNRYFGLAFEAVDELARSIDKAVACHEIATRRFPRYDLVGFATEHSQPSTSRSSSAA